MCASMTSIEIPESVTEIEKYAFMSCLALERALVPDSVTSIGDRAFSACENLTLVVDEGSCAEQYAKENDISFLYSDISG